MITTKTAPAVSTLAAIDAALAVRVVGKKTARELVAKVAKLTGVSYRFDGTGFYEDSIYFVEDAIGVRYVTGTPRRCVEWARAIVAPMAR